jgi:hypothetical protein
VVLLPEECRPLPLASLIEDETSAFGVHVSFATTKATNRHYDISLELFDAAEDSR